MFIWLSHIRAKSEFLTSQLRETTPTENIGPSGYLGVGRGADSPTPGKNLTIQKPCKGCWMMGINYKGSQGPTERTIEL
jgi:hypothetical protein